LIRELGQQHTILLSTHILSEVEATCDGVIIIHRGRVAVASSLEELKARAGAGTHLEMVIAGSGDVDVFRSVHGVLDLRVGGRTFGETVELRITTNETEDVAPRLCHCAAVHEWRLVELRVVRPTLEDLFVQITQDETIPAGKEIMAP
jgi:ABC-2 type transport system ATP-binding protein